MHEILAGAPTRVAGTGPKVDDNPSDDLGLGAPVVYPTLNGRSMVCDGRGRIVGELACKAPRPRLMVDEVVPGGSPTPLRRTGDLFARPCMAALAAPSLTGASGRVGPMSAPV